MAVNLSKCRGTILNSEGQCDCVPCSMVDFRMWQRDMRQLSYPILYLNEDAESIIGPLTPIPYAECVRYGEHIYHGSRHSVKDCGWDWE